MQNRVWKLKRKWLASVVIPVPTPLPFPLTSSVTHLAARCSLYMFPYSSELLDTLSSTQAYWHAQICSDACTHPMHVTDLCTCWYTDRHIQRRS